MTHRIPPLVLVAAVVAAMVTVITALGTSQTRSVYASSVAGIASAGETGIQIQNLDASQGATISADFYTSAGDWEQTINLPLTAPSAGGNISLEGTSLPTGAYAVIVTADRRIAAISRTDWPSSGGSIFYSNVVLGNNIALPLAVRNYHGQSSLVAVQNTDTGSQAQITVTVFAAGSAQPTVSRGYAISPGLSVLLDLAGDPEFATLGDGFLGSIFVTSTSEVGVISLIDIANSEKAVYAFEGVPAETAAETLYAPLFRAKQYLRRGDPASGRLDTGIAVSNPGTLAVDVAITYHGAGGTCAGETVTGPTVTIPPHAGHVFYQGDPAREGLPEDCYGSAVIRSSGGGILAIVNEAQNLNQTAAAYNAMTADQGGRTVALPLYRKNHASGLSTGISVMNLGTEDAEITLSLAQNNPNGTTTPVICGAPCTQTVGPNRTAIFWPGSIAEIPSNSYGSATVQSTQPVAVIVNDVNPFTGQVDMATYNGIKSDVPSGVGLVALPLALNRFVLE